MSRGEELRAEAQRLYAEAAKIRHGEERLIVVLRAMELEAEADMLERPNAPAAEARQHVVQQQQQRQPKNDNDKKE
jgi:hypothetical protein